MSENQQQENFQNRITDMGGFNAYLDLKQDSPLVLVLIHEHLGLASYLKVIAQSLTNQKISIAIPNYFPDVVSESQQSNDDLTYLKKMNQTAISHTILETIRIIRQKEKAVILVGLSIGAAIGLKILQIVQDIQFSMFFYGLPPLKTLKVSKIKCPTTIFMAQNDQVLNLSDPKMTSQAKKVFTHNSSVQIRTIQGVKHGFMNPYSQNFSEETFAQCCELFMQKLQSVLKNGLRTLPSWKTEAQVEKAQKKSDCQLI